MTLAPVIGIITALMLLMQHQTTARIQAEVVAAEADTIARNMLVYRRAVVAYLAANPAASGTVPDASLTLPTWFVKYAGVTNTISSGTIYVYMTNPPAGLAQKLMAATNNAATVGVKRSGILINPLSTTNLTIPITVPTSILEGALVIVG